MKRRRTILIFLALILLVSGISHFWLNHEPEFHGKTVTQWLDRIEDMGAHHSDNEVGCEAAFAAFGTNALPVLLKYSKARDGKLRAGFLRFINGQKLVPIHFKTAEERRGQVYLAFVYLGTNAWPAVPELTKLVKDPDEGVRRYALGCFANLHLDMDTWLGVMTNCLDDASPVVSQYAAERIRLRYPVEARYLVVPNPAGKLAPPNKPKK